MISDYTYYQGDFPKQGCLFHDPKIHTPFTEIYNGYDPDFWGDYNTIAPETTLQDALKKIEKSMQEISEE